MNDSRKLPYLISVLKNKCPRCREGDLFIKKNPYDLKNNVKMHETCPICGQLTEIEVGFFYGTSYVSYGIGVLMTVLLFVLYWLILGVSINDNSLFYFLGLNTFLLIILQPPLMRLSRTLWLSWFVKYDADWNNKKAQDYERVNKDQMNNW